MNLTALAHQRLSTLISNGDIVVDATIGNGGDTLFLATAVGDEGHVYGFDIQPQAIESTTQRLNHAGLAHRVTLHLLGHQYFQSKIPTSAHQSITAVMFNLGYLPGGNKSVITQAATTIAALEQSLSLISANGVISLMVYAGHHGGEDEALAINRWIEQLDSSQYIIERFKPESVGRTPPQWILIRRVQDI